MLVNFSGVLPLTSSIKREIRTFHVVVVRQRKRNVLNKCAALAKLLFCQIYTFLSFSLPSPSSLFKLPNTKLQTDRRLLRPRLYGEILSWVEVSLVCPSYSLPPHPNPGEANFSSFLYKTWRTVYTRNIKLAGLKGWPVTRFSMVGSPY